MLRDNAINEGDAEIFSCQESDAYSKALTQVEKSRNRSVKELFPFGFSTHHAGTFFCGIFLVNVLFLYIASI